MGNFHVIKNAVTGEIVEKLLTQEEVNNLLVVDVELTKTNAKNELLEIDLASIRAMREYIASKADAPQILKDRETAAQAARAKLK
jgi:hypothetical protein